MYLQLVIYVDCDHMTFVSTENVIWRVISGRVVEKIVKYYIIKIPFQ